MDTLKVLTWGEGQGDFVVIDAKDFDERKHTIFEGKEQKQAYKKKTKEAQTETDQKKVD
jgi:hypothetical protein